MEEKKLPAGITAEMVADAKQKHGEKNVKFIELPLDDEGKEMLTVLAAVPSRKILGQYRRYSDTDPAKADEILVKNCILSSREQVLADDGLFLTAVGGLAELIPVRKAVIKNV